MSNLPPFQQHPLLMGRAPTEHTRRGRTTTVFLIKPHSGEIDKHFQGLTGTKRWPFSCDFADFLTRSNTWDAANLRLIFAIAIPSSDLGDAIKDPAIRRGLPTCDQNSLRQGNLQGIFRLRLPNSADSARNSQVSPSGRGSARTAGNLHLTTYKHRTYDRFLRMGPYQPEHRICPSGEALR